MNVVVDIDAVLRAVDVVVVDVAVVVDVVDAVIHDLLVVDVVYYRLLPLRLPLTF